MDLSIQQAQLQPTAFHQCSGSCIQLVQVTQFSVQHGSRDLMSSNETATDKSRSDAVIQA